jgi:hypothetical protein
MKSCTYCGRENENEAVSCQECGTEIAGATTEEPNKAPIDWAGIKYVVLAVSAIFGVLVFYLLSFGPVARWTGTKAVPAPVTVTNGNTFTMIYTVTYPAWVGVIYYPAFELIGSGGGGRISELYAHYMQWWENSQGSELQ